MLEFYWAYADYHDLMDLTEAMFRQLARDITGAEQFIYQGLEIDFGKPFVRMSVRTLSRTTTQLAARRH